MAFVCDPTWQPFWQHSPLLVPFQELEGVGGHRDRGQGSDEDKTKALVKFLITEGSMQLFVMSCIKVNQSRLDVDDLRKGDPFAHASLEGRMKAADVDRSA